MLIYGREGKNVNTTSEEIANNRENSLRYLNYDRKLSPAQSMKTFLEKPGS